MYLGKFNTEFISSHFICHKMRISIFICIMFLTKLSTSYDIVGFNDIDRARYEDGKIQFTLMEKQSLVPRYGTCWKGAIKALVDGCKALTDDVQSRLALAYLNCFLEVQGRPTHECDETMSFKECVFFLDDADRGSLTTFFTHTQNICYFLESQMWHDETETTINRLAKNSESVADQLEMTSELQSKIIEKQGESLQNQHRILATANNLSDSISESSINLQSLSSDLKKTSEQQKLLVKLQTMVLGEISGFYSIVYYVLAMIVAYIVTSTARTSGARLWLFAIITVNIAIEWLLLSKNMAEWLSIFGQDARDNWDEMLYEHQWLCRKICAVVCVVVIGYAAYRYSDVNWINNKLLLEIRQQNSDLRHLLQGHNIQLPTPDSSPESIRYVVRPVAMDTPGPLPAQQPLNHTTSLAADSTGYESNLDIDSSTSHGASKNYVASLPTHSTFQPSQRGKDDTDSDSDNFITPLSTLESDFSMNGDLHRSSTPMSMLELKSRISTWTKTGKHGHLSNGLVTSTSTFSELSGRRSRTSYNSNYNLRSNLSNREASPASSNVSRARRKPNKTMKKASISPTAK